MLTAEKNDLLTRVGPGTPMGDLLRRYWHPVAGAAELDDNPIKPIRLFGEDLVLYRDLSGTYGLIDRQCPHRRADMSYGFADVDGLRCSYHGWQVNEVGAVVSIPYDDLANPGPAAKLKSRCKVTAYPVRELAGMLWVYMGPAPAPELPVWEPLARDNGFAEVVISEIPCNWLQCQENSIDPVHFEWMHDTWPARMKGDTDFEAAKHLKLAFVEFEYGLMYRRIREGMTEADDAWTVGRVCLWPNGFVIGDHIEWRIPIDDENTIALTWFHTRVPRESEPYVQDKVPAWHSPIVDEDGRWITSHIMNQDYVGWVGQGRIADRSKETLSASDVGISMLRKRLFDDLDAIAAGKDPSGVVRDPGLAKFVDLPIPNREFFRSIPRAEWMKIGFFNRRIDGNPWAVGQPDAVRRAFRQAIGLEG